jgi:hypothetical protein
VWPSFSVADYDKLPTELKDGAIKAAYESSAASDFKYEDGSTKNYICQTCHLSSTTGQATSLLHNKPAARKDLPLHNLTGGNYWAPVAIKYMNGKGTLRLGGGLTQAQIASLDDGVERAKANLRQAAKLSVSENEVKVVNLTGHKLISGYPEGRRMWLNVKWYDANNKLLREDGKYGQLSVNLDGRQMAVSTLLDLKGKNTRIYEVHGSMTQRWATQLLDMGVSRDLPLSFDRVSGAVDYTLGDLAKARSGSVHETFHFVLNNNVAKDNRIPPYGMKYSEAKKRNALPVPFCQFGCPSSNGTFEYYDEVDLSPPKGAVTASIDLVYQPTSWEYIQFLYLANKGGNAFLAEEGANLLDAWLNTGMAEPYVMASATWTRGKNGS